METYVIHTTKKCNADCLYCYEQDKTSLYTWPEIERVLEELLRKNCVRANPDRPDSILQHSLSDEKLADLYRDSDWAEFSAGDPERVVIQGISVPYAVFPNEDDVTTERGSALGQRLADTLARLWRVYTAG